MATYTTNYNLKKPGSSDAALISDINGNMDTIDSTLKNIIDNYLPLSGGTLTGSLQLIGTNGITSNNIIFNDWKLGVARNASGKLYRFVGLDVDATTGWLKTRSASDVANDLGIGDKVDKTTDAYKVYATGSGGSQTAIPYAYGATADTIAYRDTGGVLSVGTPTANAHATTKQYVDNNFQTKAAAVAVTIATSDWSSNACTKNVTGVTASNTVIVSPAPASISAYGDAGVYCSAQGAGTLSFACSATPSSSITVNVVILP